MPPLSFSVGWRRVRRMEPLEQSSRSSFAMYRYIQFSASNQFFMMARAAGCGLPPHRGRGSSGYPRFAGPPRAGFTGRTVPPEGHAQLAAGSNYQFGLGYAAIHVNGGTSVFAVDDVARRFSLASMTVDILGMAFKAENDDIRSSLVYKLKKLLKLQARRS